MNGSRLNRLAILAATALAACRSTGVAQHPASEKLQHVNSVVPVSTRPTLEPVLAADVVNGFEFLYRFITETEFVLCLEGRTVDGRVRVEAFRLARIDASSATHVRYQPCTSDRYIGTAHNHPPVDGHQQCVPSDLDRRSFSNDARAVVDIVLCGDGQYAWSAKDGGNGIALLPPQVDLSTRTVAAQPPPR